MKLPVLYKKTTTGAIQYWDIQTIDNMVVTQFGQVGGKQQRTEDVIGVGKNLGRSNETTPIQQAEAEAQAKWTKQIERKGYVENLEQASAGKNDLAGPPPPMLAKKFFDQESNLTKLEDGGHIHFPALVQPKLNGIRCQAVIKDGKCTLWSRTGKLITSMPHINKAYEKALPHYPLVVDGELFNMEYGENFEYTAHLVRQDEPTEGYEAIEHHIYDLPSLKKETNRIRAKLIADGFSDGTFEAPLIYVETTTVNSLEGMLVAFRHYRDLGYEGAIVRNIDGLYVNHRSFDLQKVVEHITEEFPILRIEEGCGKLRGHVGAFWMQAKNGKEFKAKLNGDTGRLKEYFDDHSLWEGKLMTVRYRTLSQKNKVPLFPVALSLRDYE